jgi:ABC-type multidrug transport system fused ATPase/permease subunit
MVKQKVSKKKSLKSMSPKQYLKLTLVVALIGFLFASITSVVSYPSDAHRTVMKEKAEISSKLLNVADYESKEAKDLENKLDSLNETPESKYTGNVQLYLGTLGSLVFSFVVVGFTYFYIRRHTVQRKLVTVVTNSAVNLVASIVALLPWLLVDWVLQGRPDILASFGGSSDGSAALTVGVVLLIAFPLLLLIILSTYLLMSFVFAGYEWFTSGDKSVSKKKS